MILSTLKFDRSQTRKKAAEVRKSMNQTGSGTVPISLTEIELKVILKIDIKMNDNRFV